MLEPRYRWNLADNPPIDPALGDALDRHGVVAHVATLLAARGVLTAADVDAFLGPAEAGLHDPRLLPDAEMFIERLGRARAGGERILVFGDFDADGLSGLAVMVRALRRAGHEAIPYVPSRLDEGHGLSLASIEAAVAAGATLIVTVDCGSTSGAEIAAAALRGIDILVTDHHRVPAVLPAAAAIVNPHRPESIYPERELSGSGVAFKLAGLILESAGVAAAEHLDLADLATIGTISDVAPLLGENRAIVRLGLARMRTAPRPGIAALLRKSRVEPSRVDTETIGFQIAPRLNAPGRVGDAIDAAHLLLADDPAEADALADRLEAANLLRREQLRGALAEARTAPDAVDDAAVTFIRGSWPVGIVGLVAGRLADEHGRPAIVGTEIGDIVRASCRGDGRVHLADALANCDDLLIRHGGHAAAAGFEVRADQWDALRERILAIAATVPRADSGQVLDVAIALPAPAVNYALHRDLARLAPHGAANPGPLLAVLGLTVVRARAANGGHTQLVLRRERDVLDGIAFGWEALAGLVREGDRIDVVARLGSRSFGGVESLQLEVVDAAPAGAVFGPVPGSGATMSGGIAIAGAAGFAIAGAVE